MNCTTYYRDGTFLLKVLYSSSRFYDVGYDWLVIECIGMRCGLLMAICLLTVARIIPYQIPLVLVLIYMLLRNRENISRVDYSLLATFIALFIFIGNLGRIPQFSSFLERIMAGRETLTAVLASQIMSNVPAALLLSGFTDNYRALIVGTAYVRCFGSGYLYPYQKKDKCCGGIGKHQGY